MNFEIKIKEKSFFNKHDKSKIKVLKNIDIKINSNEFVCIVGPSGCGKTTLMNMIGGLIETKDQIINSKSPNGFSGESFGYVFQTSRLLPWLTVKENVELENISKYVLQRQKNSTNPRVPYPYNMYQTKPSLVTATQVRHDPNLYNHLNSNPNNTSGCVACRKRLWEPIQ